MFFIDDCLLSSFEGIILQKNSLEAMAKRSHPFPYRTRKLSSLAPMVVGGSPPVRVGRCQAKPLLLPIRGFYFVNFIENYLNGPLVKRLRHRPFTAVTRVRIPYGSPLMYDKCAT